MVLVLFALRGEADRAPDAAATALREQTRPQDARTEAVQTIATPRAAKELARLGRGVDDTSLTDTRGVAVTWGELIGEPRAVFFGFTHCPEICPTTNSDMAAAIARIGPSAQALKIDFVTVDPDRDSADMMRDYLSSWGPSFRGYTGEATAVRRLATSYRAAYRRVPLENGDYTMDHTTSVYLVNAQGVVRDIVAYQAPPKTLDAQLKRFLDEQ